MIEVEGLTRRYGATVAVRDVSFTVARGEVVGFLGPNGAGKSTTMRILAGALGATAGSARIAGHDVFESPEQVKRKVGYLPERPPLYEAMCVADYVAFAARIKGVDAIAPAVDRALDAVDLQSVRHRIIGHLSKGFQQRVGLAQALVHDPEVLILDEPTSGLDPAQRVEIRQLLRTLAASDRTVILSTHVLAEVESVCQRAIIIDQGVKVAEDTIEGLRRATGGVELQVARPDGAAAALAHHGMVEDLGDGNFRVRSDTDVREAIAAAAVPFGLLEFSSRAALEDVYLRLTGDERAP